MAVKIYKQFFEDWKRGALDTFESLPEDRKGPKGPTSLVILPLGSPTRSAPDYTSYEYHLAYKVPFWRADYYVDAQTGEFILRTNRVMR